MTDVKELEEEIVHLKNKVRRNPWPWLVGGFAVGLVIGAIFL